MMSNHILSYTEFPCNNGFSDVLQDKNYFVQRQRSNHLPPEIAIQNQSDFLQSLGMNIAGGWITEGTVFGIETLFVDQSNVAEWVGYNSNLATRADGFDAVFSTVKGLPIATGFADCPQIMVSGPDMVGIIHAGRSNLDQEILFKAIDSLREKTDIGGLSFALTPYIAPEVYIHRELKMERTPEWLASGALLPQPGGGHNLDLKKIILDDFASMGVGLNKIFDMQIDTVTSAQKAMEEGAKWCNSQFAFTNRTETQKTANIIRGTNFVAVMLE